MIEGSGQGSVIKVINPEVQSECLIDEVVCLQQSRCKLYVFYFLSICTLGFTWLLAYWSTSICKVLKFKLADIATATHFHVKNWDNKSQIVKKVTKELVLREGEPAPGRSAVVAFQSRFIRYYYDPVKEVFSPPLFPMGERLEQLQQPNFPVFDEPTRKLMLQTYGQNLLTVPVHSKLTLFLEEVLSPFEVFQLYAILLWLCEAYYTFPVVLLIASIYVYISNVNLLQQNQKKLRDQSFIRLHVDTLRIPVQTPGLVLTQSHQLVPGDLFLLPSLCRVPCDCVVLLGSALVDENYITGETYPTRKHEIQNLKYQSDYADEVRMYMGTEVLEIQESSTQSLQQKASSAQFRHLPHRNNSILCMAIRTGYLTTRGQYMRSIMFPIPQSSKFRQEAFSLLAVMFLITVLGFLACLQYLSKYRTSGQLFVMFLDLVATSIPPSLPIIMSVGIGFAAQKLRAQGITCNLPQKIMVGGRVDTVCFEKSGTLTKREVSVLGFVLSQKGQLSQIITKLQPDKISPAALQSFWAMATCHSVSRSEINRQVSYKGSPIDTEILKFSTGVIEEDKKTITILGEGLRVLKTFPFSASTQRMGVVVSVLKQDSQKKYFVKGSPERILPNCLKETLPINLEAFIGRQAQKGYKLIALASRTLQQGSEATDLTGASARKLEKDLTFLGIIVLQNQLQLQSQATVRRLLHSRLNVKILSGDNEMTTSSVAFGVGLLDYKEPMLCDLTLDDEGNKKISVIPYRGSGMVQDSGGLSKLRQKDEEPEGKVQDTKLKSMQASEQRMRPNIRNQDEFIKEFLFSVNQSNNQIFGMTGRLFQQLFVKRTMPQLLESVFDKTVFFSRMLPKHKMELLQYCQQNNRIAAVVGESIREGSAYRSAEVSLAVMEPTNPHLLAVVQQSSFSHFTSSKLSQVLDLLRVCQAGLSTNFQTLRMLCQFSLLEFTTIILLNMNLQEFNNTEFLYIDLFIMCPIFITLSLTEPCDQLGKVRPPASIFSRVNVLSMLGIFAIQVFSQVAMMSYLKSQPWYLDRRELKLTNIQSGEGFTDGLMLSSTMFVFSNFLYLGIVISTSIAKPFRKEFYTNVYLVSNVLLLWTYNLLIPFSVHLVPSTMEVEQLGPDWYILVVVWGNVVCAFMYLYERLLNWMFESQAIVNLS